ncbi:uncharacterized protein ASPGLDRAFT_26597 [Aspergillus glaucus CBS 516.65]|uniref:Uncharacterized protein n=1 Tax=Aspergillus glaucus CBS 516.65 TaxID=1160497 RepID=A0A1L9VGE9_ASPGL|nr:hypothetical protein ASPGLDRAFT_26597 [Aspergillus glaucus CBS 516.65]OJJ82970.1 hypothetical protein ASPGLDRAFT_26597 [Aspergillus glaucus CBS 516.65]
MHLASLAPAAILTKAIWYLLLVLALAPSCEKWFYVLVDHEYTYSSSSCSSGDATGAIRGGGSGTSVSHTYTDYTQNAAACLVFLNTFSGEGADRGEISNAYQDSMVNSAWLLTRRVETPSTVHVLPHVDLVVSSLAKIFSGDCKVMGGSAILGPEGRYYQQLKSAFEADYEDNYWAEDKINDNSEVRHTMQYPKTIKNLLFSEYQESRRCYGLLHLLVLSSMGIRIDRLLVGSPFYALKSPKDRGSSLIWLRQRSNY